MSVREYLEKLELTVLSERAAKSSQSQKARQEEPCPFRTAFQRDRDRVIHSKSFRRLKHKTQVYISPGDHYRMRMTHSLEVAQISRTIARSLRLNEDLTEAIALGHDVGHTPFGHAGEFALRDFSGHFNHNEQSLRVVRYLEKNGQGLNLTQEVEDGILCHTGPQKPSTLEGCIVRIGDRIAYLCHDFDDGIRAGMLKPSDLPQQVASLFGRNPSQMITAMVSDIVETSSKADEITMSAAVQKAMDEFREFMFETLYFSPALQLEREKAKFIILSLVSHFLKNPHKLPEDFLAREAQWGLKTSVIDYVAGLTDLYAIRLFEEFFLPKKSGYQ
ncbi:MAG: deoxyguanosinetriphosphate triphosphohydrolase [Sporomusaceae bacterium]|nr:deoxyguanosinetriphosphate triphosphohydrolase [Sporomusaceae bacterium]